MNEDIKTLQAELKVLRQRKEKRRIEKRSAPRRIGRQKFLEEDIDLNLPEHISGNLRNVQQEGSILSTAFKSMQKRNILAPTVDIGLRRRGEVKRYTRNSHKEVQLPLKTKKTIKSVLR